MKNNHQITINVNPECMKAQFGPLCAQKKRVCELQIFFVNKFWLKCSYITQLIVQVQISNRLSTLILLQILGQINNLGILVCKHTLVIIIFIIYEYIIYSNV